MKQSYTGFKTAKELDISPEMRKALIWVLKQMGAGKFEHEKQPYVSTKKAGFNMNIVAEKGEGEYHCNTTACIAGWAAIHMLGVKSIGGKYHFGKREQNKIDGIFNTECENWPLQQLFYYRTPKKTMGQTTPKQAAVGLRRYLKTGSCYK